MGRKIKKPDDIKWCIESAAAKLFTARGYESVTMREIAKEAGCSHTLIYLHYKDKEDLLQHMAIPSLLQLEERMKGLLERTDHSPDDVLKSLSRDFTGFCLCRRSMVSVFFGVSPASVDTEEKDAEIHRLRSRLFGYLREALRRCLPGFSAEANARFARIYFFTMRGLIDTYRDRAEPADDLLERALPLVDSGMDILLAGMRQPSGP